MKYGLLPRCHKDGGEVFSYPAELDELDELLQKAENGDGIDANDCILYPYGCKSYAEYYAFLDSYIEKYRKKDPALSEAIAILKETIQDMNVKEDWSVMRYTGSQFDNDPKSLAHELTKGRCYYWPCSKEHPVYEGVIDNEEFAPYLYPCDPDSWEIVEDPTGMAARALAGDADTISSWYVELAKQPNSIDEWASANGLVPKRQRLAPALAERLEENWRGSECDIVNVICPQCGEDFDYGAWTLVNARSTPDEAKRAETGTLFALTCPRCGFEANLEQPCLYVDPKRRLCIYEVIDDEMAKKAAEMFSDPDNANARMSTCRIVSGRNALADKIVAFNAGLDDRAIELLKFGINGNARMQGYVSEGEEITTWLEEVTDDMLVFRTEFGDTSMHAQIEMGAYDLFAEALSQISELEQRRYVVDRNWASRAFDLIDEKGLLD